MPTLNPLEAWMSDEHLVIDTETTGTDRRSPYPGFKYPSAAFCVSICNQGGKTEIFNWPVNPYTRQVKPRQRDLSRLRGLIRRYPKIVFHNSPFDIPMLNDWGIKIPWHKVEDTLAASHVCDSNESHKLKDLGIKYFDLLDTDEQRLKKAVVSARDKAKKLPSPVPVGPSVSTDYFLPDYIAKATKQEQESEVEKYASLDAVRTSLLHRMYCQVVAKQDLEKQYRRELDIIPPTLHMEEQGLCLRPLELDRNRKKFLRRRTRHLNRMREVCGDKNFNPNSSPQLCKVLYEQYRLKPIAFTKTGTPSNDKNALPELLLRTQDLDSRNFLENLLDYRKLDTGCKYLTSYEEKAILNDKGRLVLHPRYNPWGTDTTRFSSSDPNAQNVGKDSELSLRGVFGPPRGWEWYAIDYDQLEIRIMGVLSGDATLQNILKSGGDMHQTTADIFGVKRKLGKAINFAWQYGAGDKKLSAMAGVSAEDFVDGMRDKYPDVVRFMEETTREAERYGRVYTLGGYRLSTPEGRDYVGTNYRDQGTAGDIVKNAMIAVYDYLKSAAVMDDIQMVANVHDELVFQVRKRTPKRHLRMIAGLMEAAGRQLGVETPVEVSLISESWEKPETTNIQPSTVSL